METNHAACHAVLNTVELLESILLGVPVLKLFETLCVPRKWQTAIKSSLLVQQRMFLSAMPISEHWTLQCDLFPPQNPGKLESWKDIKLVVQPSTTVMKNDHEGGPHKKDFSSPIVPDVACPLLTVYGRPDTFGRNTADRELRKNNRERRDLEFDRIRKGPSPWRQMLLTNPPCMTVKLHRTS